MHEISKKKFSVKLPIQEKLTKKVLRYVFQHVTDFLL